MEKEEKKWREKGGEGRENEKERGEVWVVTRDTITREVNCFREEKEEEEGW